MTVAEFVKSKFVPEHVAVKRASGRRHYQAILKHVLTPEEVNLIFGVYTNGTRSKLRCDPNWPYLSNVEIHSVRPLHVQRLVSAALERGYSAQTVKHIRNVVSAICSHASKQGLLAGGNPASNVALPGMKRKEVHALTLAQTVKVLEAMRYPEREMALIAILTSMNMSEICGLQWKHVNLSDNTLNREGEMIPPGTIAVRKQWYRGELCSVPKGRNLNIRIPQLLHSTLFKLSFRGANTGWSDFVFASKAGTPINQINVAARRLKSIGRELQLPWLSWQVFRRTRVNLIYEFSLQFQHQMAKAMNSFPPQNVMFIKGGSRDRH
jgi:integrase